MSSFTFGFNVKPRRAGGVSYDADALAYFNANTSITSTSDKNAINTFFLGLKSDGIYAKIKAMYLPIWGTAASSKWNLVNPVDSDAAFRLSFSTGWSFASSGATPNGTSAFADTFFIPSTNLTIFNGHFSSYERKSTFTTGSTYIGGVYHSNLQSFGMYQTSTNSSYTCVQNSSNVSTDFAVKTGLSVRRGFIINNRTSSTATTFKIFINGTIQGNATTSSGGQSLPTAKFFFSRVNDASLGGANFYDNGEFSFRSLGTGLTDTEATNFYTRVNTLMTYFGINV